MKKILKKEVIIAFIIGIILASSIAVYAYSYAAKDVSYTKPGTQTAISVEQALNDLYTKKSIEKLELVNDLSSGTSNRAATATASFNSGEANQEYYLIGKYIYCIFCSFYSSPPVFKKLIS